MSRQAFLPLRRTPRQVFWRLPVSGAGGVRSQHLAGVCHTWTPLHYYSNTQALPPGCVSSTLPKTDRVRATPTDFPLGHHLIARQRCVPCLFRDTRSPTQDRGELRLPTFHASLRASQSHPALGRLKH